MNPVERVHLSAAYWRLWAASLISNVGDGVLLAALPLMAAHLSTNRLQVGLLSTFFSIPWLLFALPVGALIDRADRRSVLVAADTFRAVILTVLAVVIATGHERMWMLWILAFGLGVGEVFFDSTSQAILPAVVPIEQLERANGLRYSAEITGNTFIGAPIGSVLFALAVWVPFGTDAASFAIAAALALSLRGRFRPPEQPRRTILTTTWRDDMRDGIRWLWRRKMLRYLAISVALTNMAFAASESTFVLYATQRLGVSTRSFGLLVGVIGAGGVAAGVAGSWVVAHVGRRFAVLAASLAPAITMIAIGTVAITWWVVAMITVQAIMVTIWNIIAVSMRQSLVPDHLFGRVNSVYRWFSWGALPIGAFLGGVIADVGGLRAPYFFGAGVVVIAFVLVVRHVTEDAILAAESGADDTAGITAPIARPVDPARFDATPSGIPRDPLDDL